MFVMVGSSELTHFFRRNVGIGSRSHCLSGEAMMSLYISSSDAGFNQENEFIEWFGETECGSVESVRELSDV